MTRSSETGAARGSAGRRPRVAILGEFSAGKSTLINLLTGRRDLRTQVTATQMPAVWLSYGDGEPRYVDMAGEEHPIDPARPELLNPARTAYIRVFMRTPVLEMCDLIDTPGNSDPNIPAEAWQRIAEMADVAVWLSPSTQAWRQSEAAAWKELPAELRRKSILLLTRADMIPNDTDRKRIMRRAEKEAGPHFSKIHMASLRRFKDVHDFLHDLIQLCGKPAQASVQKVEDMAPAEPPPRAAQPKGPGEATRLWRDLAKRIPRDDPQALRTATRSFLGHLDQMLGIDGAGKGRATAIWQQTVGRASDGGSAGVRDAFKDFLTKVDAEIGTPAVPQQAAG